MAADSLEQHTSPGGAPSMKEEAISTALIPIVQWKIAQ
jgi:hypothetical protein